jgi:hypothetical protein
MRRIFARNFERRGDFNIIRTSGSVKKGFGKWYLCP